MTLNLIANDAEQTVIKEYLEQNASEILAEKINNGVIIEKDGKKLISKKTLDGFMKYATEEARKQAEKGASSACVRDSVVFGWAIHYFEEDEILGTLYNEDGSEYKPPKPAPKTVKKDSGATTPIVTKTVSKEPTGQMSMFDFMATDTDGEVVADGVKTPVKDDSDDSAIVPDTTVIEPEKPPVSPIYTKYLQYQEEYPNTVIAMRIGDFYEIFGDAAVMVAKELNMALTSRDVGLESRIEMIGYPYHKADTYQEKITAFAHLAVIETDKAPQIYLKTESTPIKVDTTTGEVIEDATITDKDSTPIATTKRIDPLSDEELLTKVYELLGSDIEIVR